MAGITWNISETLAKSVEETNAVLAKQKSFAMAVESFQIRLSNDLAEEAVKAQGLLANILGRTEVGIESLFRKILGGAEKASDAVESLNSVSQSCSLLCFCANSPRQFRTLLTKFIASKMESVTSW